MLTKYGFNRLDRLASFLCIFLGLIVLSLSYYKNISQYGLGFSFFLGGLSYFIIYKKKSANLTLSFNNGIYLNIFYVSILLVLSFSSNLITYYRPWWFFFLISLGYLSVLFNIIYVRYYDIKPWIIFIKILFLSLIYRFSSYYLYPTILGRDTQSHLKYVLSLNQLGNILFDSKYSGSPFWHILMSIGTMITNIDIKSSLFIFIVMTSFFINSILIYLIGKKLFNSRVGHISVILYNISDMVLVRSLTNINPSSLVHIMLLFLVFLLSKQKNNNKDIILLLLFINGVVLTHQLSSVPVFIYFILIYVSNHFIKYMKKDKTDINGVILQLIIVFVIYTFITSYLNSYGETNFFLYAFNRIHAIIIQILSSLVSDMRRTTSYEAYFARYGILSNVLYNLGYDLLIFYSISGFISSFNVNTVKRFKINLVFYVFSLFFLIYVGTYMGLGMLFIPHRYLPFLETYSIPFAALTILKTFQMSKTNHKIHIIICFILFFSMITTPFIIPNDPVYLVERTNPTEAKYSEIQACRYYYVFADEFPLILDPFFARTIQKVYVLSDLRLDFLVMNSMNLDGKNPIFLRDYSEENSSFEIGGSFSITYVYDFTYEMRLILSSSNNIYSSNDMEILIGY